MKTIANKIYSNISGLDLSTLFFCFFIFSIPFFRKFEFYTAYSVLDGKYIDYLTYSIYGFEVFLAIAMAIWIFDFILKRSPIHIGPHNLFYSFVALIFFSSLSIFFSESKSISLYYIIVLVEMLFIYLFVINKLNLINRVILVLNFFVLSISFQSFLAIAQFIKNSSLGLYSLGEQVLSPSIIGVAKVLFEGEKHIRPYGTFPHTNILAFFIVVAGLVSIYLFFKSKDRYYKAYLLVSLLLFAVSLVLTFSRVAWAMALILWSYLIISNLDVSKIRLAFLSRSKWKLLFASSVFLLALFLLLYFLFPSIWWRINPFLESTWSSLDARLVVFSKSWLLFKSAPFLGVGLGNFMIEIAYQLTGYPLWMAEPVHNTFFLILVETGILGLLSFVAVLFFAFTNLRGKDLFLKMILLSFIVYMFFDHCFWDIRQAQVLLFLFLGIFALNVFKKGSDVSRG